MCAHKRQSTLHQVVHNVLRRLCFQCGVELHRVLASLFMTPQRGAHSLRQQSFHRRRSEPCVLLRTHRLSREFAEVLLQIICRQSESVDQGNRLDIMNPTRYYSDGDSLSGMQINVPLPKRKQVPVLLECGVLLGGEGNGSGVNGISCDHTIWIGLQLTQVEVEIDSFVSGVLDVSHKSKQDLVNEKEVCSGLKQKKAIKHLTAEPCFLDFFYGGQWLPLKIAAL